MEPQRLYQRKCVYIPHSTNGAKCLIINEICGFNHAHRCHVNSSDFPGILMFSIKSLISCGGGGVKELTDSVTQKFRSIPNVPIPSGEIPNHQFSAEFNSGFRNLK